MPTVAYIAPPAKIEGGDILRVGKRLFVGLGSRTNRQGMKALAGIVEKYGYTVDGVEVSGCLHLKTGCTALDERTVLINLDWIDGNGFQGFRKVAVPAAEPFGANVLKIGRIICLHAGFDRTWRTVNALGYETAVVDVSEFLKAEAGLTCMSLIFDVPRSTQ